MRGTTYRESDEILHNLSKALAKISSENITSPNFTRKDDITEESSIQQCANERKFLNNLLECNNESTLETQIIDEGEETNKN